MKTLDAQRGKNLSASFPWIDFVVFNPDIMTALSTSPLRAKRVGQGKFAASIFGVQLGFEIIQHESTDTKGMSRTLADIRLPFGLGQTHTVSKYTYFAIDDKTTSLDLNLSLELTSILMRLYAAVRRGDIETYLNKICGDIETAALLLEKNDPKCPAALNDDQKQRVVEFRSNLANKITRSSSSATSLHGALRVVMTQNEMLVAAEAKMPDQHILSAKENVSMDGRAFTSLLDATLRLATINNRALAMRGATTAPAENLEFRQEALELGHAFYKRVCAGNLMSVVPIIISQGQTAALRLMVDGQAEQLPWEVMHDGQEFLSLRVRFSRCATAIHDQDIPPEVWATAGILIVGADSRGDLPGAETEAQNIGTGLTGAGVSRVEVLTGQNASRNKVIQALQSGHFNLLHFSGHSVFDANHPYQSFLELPLSSKIYLHELGILGRATEGKSPLQLVFLNSCQSARVGQDQVTGKQLSMCKTLRESGVANVIGMQWNVEDDAAVQVGQTFYNLLLANPQIGPEEAMRRTRSKVAIERAWADGSWLAPVLYT